MTSKEKLINISKKFWAKWAIGFKTIPIMLLLVILKVLTHNIGLEVMDLNALFTSLIGGTIFLIGFLITGVLSDYKESEKIPTELTSSLRSLFDDTYTILRSKNSAAALEFMKFQKSFVDMLFPWLYKKESTKSILSKISEMNEFFITFDKEEIQSNYIIKMKNEQNNIRKVILRIETIRDTDFVGSAYAIVEAMGILTGIGLIVIKIEPFYASIFLTMIVAFLITYMILLIKDLDNPFDYSIKGENGTEISLQQLHDFQEELADY
jgi:hypothetical protein